VSRRFHRVQPPAVASVAGGGDQVSGLDHWMLRIPSFFRKMALFCLPALLLSCSRAAAPEVKVDKANAMRLLEAFLKIDRRESGQPGAKRAAEFIQRTAQGYGLDARIDSFQEDTADGPKTFHNVCFEVKGKSSRFVVVGSHFDAKKFAGFKFEGANDSGSSTATLLEVARALAKSGVVPPYTVKFVCFDGEECVYDYTGNDGLHGSKRAAAAMDLKDCAAMLLLDMMGDRGLNLTVPRDSDPRLAAALFAIAKQSGLEAAWFSSNMLDDHIPFQEKGVPSLDLIDFAYGPNNAYWHSSEDTLDKLSADSLGLVGDATLRLLLTMPDILGR